MKIVVLSLLVACLSWLRAEESGADRAFYTVRPSGPENVRLNIFLLLVNETKNTITLPTANIGPVVVIDRKGVSFDFSYVPRTLKNGGLAVAPIGLFFPVVLKPGESAVISHSIPVPPEFKASRVVVRYTVDKYTADKYLFTEQHVECLATVESFLKY